MLRSGIVFDLDETLINRKGSLDVYARELYTSFDQNPTIDPEGFLHLFHELDGNGRAPRNEFFANLAQSAFDRVNPELIADHFRKFAWRKPLLFEGVIQVIEALGAIAYAIGIVTNGSSL